MNLQHPVPNSTVSYNPSNPNPSPNFSHPQFNFAPQFQSPPQSQHHHQNPLPDLPNSLSSLQNLLQLSNSTLQSLSSLLPPLPLSSKSSTQCPSNPHHWVPATSLFSHSLSCPSPIDIGPIIETLQYPKTLKKAHTLNQQNKFVQPITDHASELCFSLDDYVDFDCNFFYRKCPGVVSSFDDDATKRIFTLPGVLTVECANFVGNCDSGSDGFGGASVKFLPSGIWVIRCEVEQWIDYPNEYSFSVVRALLCVECLRECDLSMWVIENSPRFGVVVDVPMRDHIFVLFKLCLRAMVREAAHSYGFELKSNIDDGSCQLNPKPLKFKCPALVEVLRWLTSQLSILYGETNAKSFVIAMLRHLLSKASSHASLFPLDQKMDQTFVNEQGISIFRGQSSQKGTVNGEDDSTDVRIFSRPIFVYQIAAAIAALRERSLLEDRIKALRHRPPLPAYQRMAEHAYVSKKADEERQKRPDYRPVIEHDGLSYHRQHGQGTNRPKTKEELLAEERDYKRRRMSYRGKKLKRTTKEVMRDIIEEYMEVIKETGGIGGLAKEDVGVMSTSTNSLFPDGTSSMLNRSSRSYEQDGYRKQLGNDYNSTDTKPVEPSGKLVQKRKESDNSRHFGDRRTISRDRHDRDYNSTSPSRDRRHDRSREHRSRSRNERVVETNEDEHSKFNHSSSCASSHHDLQLRYSKSNYCSSDHSDKRKLESSYRHRQRKNENDRSHSFERVEIDDRYDPFEAGDVYGDPFEKSKYARPDS